MKLSQLLNNVDAIQVTGSPESVSIDDISIDSRKTGAKSLFIAIKGFNTDGHKFIQDAVGIGVKAVVIDDNNFLPDEYYIKSGVVKILVKNTRKALASFANTLYDFPSKHLVLTGITGTKGKTTTSIFIKNIFDGAGYKTGLIGTNKNIVGGKVYKSSLTTPQSNEINYLMREMVNSGCSHCVMEVSSHALELNRVDYLDYDYAVFTNITSDHMDYHKSFENYFSAKKIFFDVLKPGAKVVYNVDDPNSSKIISDSKAEKYSYGTSDNADFKLKNIEFDLTGTRFEIMYKNSSYRLNTHLAGGFNAYNAAAAFSMAVLSGVDYDVAAAAIKNTPQVPGRFEVISKGNKNVIIDYSHTADSLRQALEAIQHIIKKERPVYTVFGCGGNRDKTKRPVMGKIAAELSDKIIITSDNPRFEDPDEIIEQIAAGITDKEYKVIENREEAIRSAIERSEENAVILIAGKGHEDYQEIKGVRKFFSDKETAEKYLFGNK